MRELLFLVFLVRWCCISYLGDHQQLCGMSDKIMEVVFIPCVRPGQNSCLHLDLT